MKLSVIELTVKELMSTGVLLTVLESIQLRLIDARTATNMMTSVRLNRDAPTLDSIDVDNTHVFASSLTQLEFEKSTPFWNQL